MQDLKHTSAFGSQHMLGRYNASMEYLRSSVDEIRFIASQ